jgi:MFS family permease
MIRAVYTDREARGEAIGQWSGWSGIVTVIGPLVGGWLVDALSWRWVFFVVVPLIAVTVWLLLAFVPESRSEDAPDRLDWLGAVLVILGLGGIAYGLIEGPVMGWRSAGVLVGLIGGMVSLALFPFVEARKQEPMVPLTLFGHHNFTGANLTTLGVYFALQGTTFFVVLYLQNVMGYSALVAGLVLAPISLLLLVLSPVFGRLSGKFGARLFMTAGPLVCAVGLLLFTRLRADAGFWSEVLPAVVVFGLGMSGTVAPLTDTVMSAVSEAHSGIAAAFNNVVSRVAGLLAVAGLGVVVTLTFNRLIARRIEDLSLSPSTVEAIRRVAEEPTGAFDVEQLPPEAREAVDSSYTAGFRRAMLVSASMAAAGGVLAALTIRDRTSREGEEKE